MPGAGFDLSRQSRTRRGRTIVSIYLNHAGTTWPKPEPVVRAVADSIRPEASFWETPFERLAADAAGDIGPADQILWTAGGTSALALAIEDLPWSSGDVVLTSSMEHIAVERPLLHLLHRGVQVQRLPRTPDSPLDLQALQQAFKAGPVQALVLTAAANTTGERMPIQQAASLAAAQGTTVLVDASQTAGWGPDPVGIWDGPCEGVDLFAFTGHKALLGPWGIGGLSIRRPDRIRFCTPRFEHAPPSPGYCDAGSVNRCALAALGAAASWRRTRPGRFAECGRWADRLHAALSGLKAVRLLHDRRPGDLPTLCFVVDGASAQDVSSHLRRRGLIVSAGQQCAPSAYAALGRRVGAIRISLGAQTTGEEVEAAEQILCEALTQAF